MEKLSGRLAVRLAAVIATASMLLPLAWAGGGARTVSVPALGVRGEGLPGVVNYIVIQFERTTSADGPVVQFNEINLGGGSLVGEEWKEGVRRAVRAVARAVDDDGRDWLITIKNRSMTALTDGMSAGAAVAVGIMAAYKGDAIGADVALSGQITPDGRLEVVGGLPVKVEAAAGAHYRAIVVPRDQVFTSDWGLTKETADRRRVRLIQAGTLEEAYQVMTGNSR
jgi:hypothetical protein